MTIALSRWAFLGAASARRAAGRDTVIDVHQHTVYGPRDGERLVVHRRAMGVTTTALLRVGTRTGLKPGAGANQSAVDLARRYPRKFKSGVESTPSPLDPNKSPLESGLAARTGGGTGYGLRSRPRRCPEPS